MKKFTLFYSILFFTVILSACSEKKDDVTPASIEGKWSFSALGSISNTKTYEANADKLKKVSTSGSVDYTSLTTDLNLEFKSNGTYVGGTEDNGKWVLSSDRTQLTLTSNVDKDANGKPLVQTFGVQDLTANSVKLTFKKVTKEAGKTFVINNSTVDDLQAIFMASIAASIKGTPAELLTATSLQGYISLKK